MNSGLKQAPDAPVRTWRDSGVAHIRFNRPAALNAIDLALAQGFLGACEGVARDPSVRVVVLSGEGRSFMAGGDLVAMQREPVLVASALIEHMHAAIGILTGLSAPVIASVQGDVAGGGLGLALSCDLCIAAEDTRMSLAYHQIGTSPDCGTSWGLERALGLRQALHFALVGGRVLAADALRLGLVSQVVAIEALAQETARVAARLAAGPTAAFGRTKRLLRAAGSASLAAQLDAERDAFLASAGTTDFQEGVDAFLGKRTPLFTGL
jgi:2-(1,2-epoxy-1,2-dihydrophenyl)acetyl-CoA isomerase